MARAPNNADAPPRPSLRERVSSGLEYVFGRNALIGFAALLLLLLSGYATWAGMSDFILGVQGGAIASQPGGFVGLSVQTEWLIILLVVTLTFLMWLALRETFGVKRTWGARAITLPLYLFLALWSVGFGYGFWWSLIAGPEATKTGLAGQAEDVRDAAVLVKARLEAVRARLDSVGAHSTRQMSREASSGGSCGVRSGAGRGPLFRAREGVRDSVSALQANIDQQWLAAVDRDLVALNEELARAGTASAGETLIERQQAFETAAAQIRGNASALSARSNALGAAYASEMRQLAAEVSIPPGETGFSCHDPSLAALLTEAAAEAERPLDVSLRAAAFSEGAAGVANAVLGLWTNIGGHLSALPSYLTGGGAPSAVEGQGVTGRDLIALLAALGVDLGLFALTALNPPPPPRLSRAKQEVLNRALRITLERAEREGDVEWLKKHIFHHDEDAYLVVPNYYSCLNKDVVERGDDDELARWAEMSLDEVRADRKAAEQKIIDALDGDELQRGQALNLFAGVLVDIDLVKYLSKSKLEALLKDEQRTSVSVSPKMIAEGDAEEDYDIEKIRNHGVLSKARHALKNARWSQNARKDPEIYVLVDNEGLSPFLQAFNRAGAVAMADASGATSREPSVGPQQLTDQRS